MGGLAVTPVAADLSDGVCGATVRQIWLKPRSFRIVNWNHVVALNAAGSANQVSFSLRYAGIGAGTATPYLTNGSSSTAAQSARSVSSGAFTAAVPARSLVMYVIRAN
jgi:glucosylceramidase